MSVKKYGIYLAYPPTIELRHHGLGRHLAEFLKGAQERPDVTFVIACPSWMKSGLMELFKDAGIQNNSFEMISPRKKPLILEAYEYLNARKMPIKEKVKKKKYYIFSDFNILNHIKFHAERIMVSTRSKTIFVLFSIIIAPLIFIFILFVIHWRVILHIVRAKNKIISRKVKNYSLGQNVAKKKYRSFFSPFKKLFILIKFNGINVIQNLITKPKDNLFVIELFKIMRNYEAGLLTNLINTRSDITAWYCPTAFWPDFNNIQKPHILCVPDVVLADFPISFSLAGTDRMLDNFLQVESSIKRGENFLTYSEDVKWRTLAERYHKDPEKIFVVPHGVNAQNAIIKCTGSLFDKEVALTSVSHYFFKFALNKSMRQVSSYLILNSSNIKFIFYASQFRPNKNVISLLKAYHYLFKKKYIPYKLILTGNPKTLPEINDFIYTHNLENDVLCLHGLSAQELAACYKLADLAVNPSLSEGGCPFTLTEALSVDTPVVMARIPVTLEVIKDPDLDKDMLFDPYDWKDMADRIEWALQNKEELLAKQKVLYKVLEKRTWRTVVDEYIDILDRISQEQKETPQLVSKKSIRNKRLKDAA